MLAVLFSAPSYWIFNFWESPYPHILLLRSLVVIDILYALATMTLLMVGTYSTLINLMQRSSD